MSNLEFESTMRSYYEKLKGRFGTTNIRIVDANGLNWNNKLFLIRKVSSRNSMLEDTALIIRVQLKRVKSDNKMWCVTSFYSYPHLTAKDETDIVAAAGEVLETIVPGEFVICESGNGVKVNIMNATRLSDIFGQRTPHAV